MVNVIKIPGEEKINVYKETENHGKEREIIKINNV